jgi:hypothetical protein
MDWNQLVFTLQSGNLMNTALTLRFYKIKELDSEKMEY